VWSLGEDEVVVDVCVQIGPELIAALQPEALWDTYQSAWSIMHGSPVALSTALMGRKISQSQL
jgi:hypothetical protein